MPNDKPNNTKKYGPAPEQAPDALLASHGFIAVKECSNCDGFHVAITDTKGVTLVCSQVFDSYEEGLAAAKEMLGSGGHNVNVTESLDSIPPELLN